MKNGKWLALLLALMLSLSMISTTAFADSDAWDDYTPEEFSVGDGTEANPYQIANTAQFYYFTQHCENKYYVLTNDIDLEGREFPIISKFAGVLDGDSHKIVNLNITSSTSGCTAMIAICTGTVKNLSVYGTVTSSAQRTAAIVGLLNGGKIENCKNYCTINAKGGGFTGGIAGYFSDYMGSNAEISNCANLGSINTSSVAAGIAGLVSYFNSTQDGSGGSIDEIPSITSCQNVADISGKYAAGICGYQYGTTISKCVNTGKITGNYAGGIVFNAYSENCLSVTRTQNESSHEYYNFYSYSKCSSFIHDCYNTGEVSGVISAGGIVDSFPYCTYNTAGFVEPTPPDIEVFHEWYPTEMGIINCYNVGKVNATGEDSAFGDILGRLVQSDRSSDGIPEKCLYLTGNNFGADESLQTYGTACSDTELSTVDAYNNNAFNFDSVWTWDKTGAYPYAILQRVGLPLSVCNHSYVLTNSTATCTEAGTATYTCTKCGDSYTESVAANGHSPAAAVRENEVAATCTAAGSYDEVVYCSVCHEKISSTSKVIEKLAHDFSVLQHDETQHWFKCSRCDATNSKIAHTGGTATCTAKAHCEVCDAEYGELAAHDFGNNLEYCKNGCGTKNPNYVPPYNPPHKPSVKPNPTPSKPETPENPFVDVKKDDYYYDAVIWAVGKGIAKGVTDTTFQPNASCTRAEMVTFLYRAAGSPEPTNKVNPFTDVAEDSYYYKAVLWAVEKGIAKGTSETTFSPNDTCTRGQAVAFLYRYANSPAVSGSNSFADVSETAYYYNATLWAMSEKVTEGTSATTFSPNDLCTRGQIVTFLYRYMGK